LTEAPSVRNRRPPGVRREEILAVATEAFGRSGYRGVSLADIAARVGISQPGLLHHFRSKDELLIAALERRDAESTEHMQSVFREASVVDALRLYAVEFAEAIDPDHPAHEFFRRRNARVRATLADRIRRDQAEHRLSATLDPPTVAAEMIAAMDGLQVQWLLDPTFDMYGVMAAYLERYRVASR
jgi:AcrR family transcriptional regulator